jgi:hypothetical protein
MAESKGGRRRGKRRDETQQSSRRDGGRGEERKSSEKAAGEDDEEQRTTATEQATEEVGMSCAHAESGGLCSVEAPRRKLYRAAEERPQGRDDPPKGPWQQQPRNRAIDNSFHRPSNQAAHSLLHCDQACSLHSPSYLLRHCFVSPFATFELVENEFALTGCEILAWDQ